MVFVPYNFDPEYSVDEIVNHPHLITETTTQPLDIKIVCVCIYSET